MIKTKYARVAVLGLNKELVLTKLKDQVVFYDIEKTENQLAFSLNKKCFKKVVAFLNKRKIKFKVLKKLDFIYVLKLICQNAGIVLGVGFWLVFSLVFSNHHFGVKIKYSNLTNEQNQQVLLVLKDQILNEQGKTNREYERNLLTKLNFLSGITIQKEGLNYIVSLYKRTLAEPVSQILAPYHLKIKEVVVASGKCLVSPGDVAPKGSVLATESTENGIIALPKILLKAEAYVIGTSYFDKNAPVLTKTGNSYSASIISLLGINLSKNPELKYKYYDKVEETVYTSFNNFLPISKTTITFYEKDFIKDENNQPDMLKLKEQAKQDAINLLNENTNEYQETYTQMQDGENIMVKCYLKFDYIIN